MSSHKKRGYFRFATGLCFAAIACFTIYYFLPPEKIPEGVMIDRIVVIKSRHELQGYARGHRVVTYKVALGKIRGPKEYEGDFKTPEGIYIINDRNPNGGYYKNLVVSYPNARDIARAQQLGKAPGGLIKIHGLKNGQGYIGKLHRWRNWTFGCIALNNRELDELYNHVALGTPIEIRE